MAKRPSDPVGVIRIRNLEPRDERRAAELLVDQLPEGWPTMREALREVREAFARGRIRRAACEGRELVGWIGGLEMYPGFVVELHPLAHAWNSGQRVAYWREEPLEVDGVLDGSWGSWAVEVKTGPIQTGDLRGLLEFNRRFPAYRPLLIGDAAGRSTAERAGIASVTWRDFLVGGPPGSGRSAGREP